MGNKIVICSVGSFISWPCLLFFIYHFLVCFYLKVKNDLSFTPQCPKDIYILLPGTCKCYLTWLKKKVFAGVIKLKILRQGDYPRMICNRAVPKHNLMCHYQRKSERDFYTEVPKQCEDRAEKDLKMTILKIGVMQPQTKECQQPPGGGRDKKQILLHSFCRKCNTADTLVLAQ